MIIFFIKNNFLLRGNEEIMKLFIQNSPNNSDLYDLIKIDNKSHYCLLQDTLENCLKLFNQTIREHSSPIGIMYSYDSSTHLVIDHTSGKPRTCFIDG